MPTVTVHLPALLRPMAGGDATVEVRADTLAGALAILVDAHPALAVHLFDETGSMREHVLCFHNDESTRHPAGLDVPIADGDRITILQAVSGGAGGLGVGIDLPTAPDARSRTGESRVELSQPTRRSTTQRLVKVLAAAALAVSVVVPTADGTPASAAEPAVPAGLALFDPATGLWTIRFADTSRLSFYYGVPGDLPLLGDWDCDGTDTVAMFRPSNGFIYLRNSNTQGVADRDFFYGLGGDIPLAGDWNGDGCDTFAIYRPSEGRVYIRNSLGTGIADYSYFFGNPGDRPFAGDFDGDGVTTVGLYRDTTGFVYFRNSNTQGVADLDFFYGVPSDRIVAGDWDGDGTDTVGIFRPPERRFYLSNANVQGFADVEFAFGFPALLPVAGRVGPGSGIVTFSDGDHTVGTDVPPGTYRSTTPQVSCTWQRYAGGAAVAGRSTTGPALATIEPGDTRFTSVGCGTWTSSPDPVTALPSSPFGPGTHRVGEEIQPGVWLTGAATGECRWERLRGFSAELDDFTTAFTVVGPSAVTVKESDIGLHTEGCGTWTLLSAGSAARTTPGSFSDGVFVVGTDLAATRYRSGVPAGSCSWNRLGGFSGEAGDLLAGRFTTTRSLVDIPATDAGFSSKGCGTWTTDLSPITAAPTADFRDGMYLVGVDIAPGIWQQVGGLTGTCIYQRLSGFTGSNVISIRVAFPSDPAPQVTIQPTDTGFSAEGCGTWLYQGPPPPPAE